MATASSIGLFASIPFDAPRPRTTRDVLFDVKTGLDFVAHNLPPAHRVLVRLNPYPRPWRPMTIEAPDGARLAAWYGPGRADGPSILFAPGTFQTKDDTPRKKRAIDLWRRLGANVLIMDLRGFGGSHAALGSGGYLESRDLHLAADRLREESGAERVALWGESLGGAVSLLAASLPRAEERFSRVLAWSPFADLREASTVANPSTDIGRSLLGRTYRWLLRHRTRNEVRDFEQYLALCAQQLGMDVETLCHSCSPSAHVRRLRVPATVFHAEDDFVVPVEHAWRLARAGAPNLQVHVLPRGSHLAFDREAPEWYAAVTRKLLAGGAA
ncbi:MAG TPA: alpha/beta fold hydrolase [Candidatus Thermoplasmatota archaeon]|nr:alpha/beta fold hydrolase [Candidatus Thermoplasmatota archaeon]